MNVIRYINPFSAQHHAMQDFSKLTVMQKLTTIFITTLVSILTLMLATTPVFRGLVGRFKLINVKQPTTNKTPQNEITAGKTDMKARGALGGKKDPNQMTPTKPSEPKRPPNLIAVQPRDTFNNSDLPIPNPDRTHSIHPHDALEIFDLNTQPNQPLFVDDSKDVGLPTDQEIELTDALDTIIEEIFSIDPERSSADKKPVNYFVSIEENDNIYEVKYPPLDDTQIEKLTKSKHITSPVRAEDLKARTTSDDEWVFVRDNADEADAISYRNIEFQGTYNLIGQFYQFINSLNNLPEDCTRVTFNEEGALCINAKKPSGVIPLEDIENFKQMIKETYGAELADRILNRYFRDSNKKSTLKDLTFSDIKKAFIGAAANVKTPDLKRLFYDIHDDFQGILPPRCVELLNPSMIKSIRQTSKFEDLTSDQLDILHRAFTTLPNKEGKCRKTLKTFFTEEEIDKLKPNHYTHDVRLLKELGHINLIDKKSDVKLYLSQHIGKKLVYTELQQGMVIPLINEDKEPCHYQVFKHLEYTGDAVIANLITPINIQNRYSTNSDETDIFLTFRGTGCSPSVKAAGASIDRDLDDSGVGKTDFHKRAEELLGMVESYLEKTDGPITLNISGHSLAACDTQRASLLISKKIADSKPSSHWRKIKHLVAHTHNSPRLDNETATEFVEVIQKLDTMVENKDLELDIDLTHVRIFARESEDFIQTLWYKLLGADIRESQVLEKRVVKLTFDQELGFFDKHSAEGFMTTSPPNSKSTHITDETEDDLLQKVLCDRYYWCDDESMSTIDKLQQTIRWYASYLHITPVTMLQMALYRTGVTSAVLKHIPRFFFKTRSSEKLVKLGWLEGRI